MVCHLLTMKQSKQWPLLTVSDCAHFASIHSITTCDRARKNEVNFQSANRKYQLRLRVYVCMLHKSSLDSGQAVDNPSVASPGLPPAVRHTLPIDHISTLYRSAFNQRRQWHKGTGLIRSILWPTNWSCYSHSLTFTCIHTNLSHSLLFFFFLCRRRGRHLRPPTPSESISLRMVI